MGKVVRLVGASGSFGSHTEPQVPVERQVDQWLISHNMAIQNPRGIERAIVSLRAGLLEYTIQYGQSFAGCELSQDGVLGDAWVDAARAYLALLNGPTGRLDCGTLDSEVRLWAERCGLTEEL